MYTNDDQSVILNKNSVDAESMNKKPSSGGNYQSNELDVFNYQQEYKKAPYKFFNVNNTIEEINLVLNSSDSDDKKIQYIDRLGEIIISGASKSDVGIIRSELKRILLKNPKSKIGRAALFTYTRSFNSEDSVHEAKSILDLGLNLGTLNISEFSGESVHMGMLFDSKYMIMSGLKNNEEYAKTVLYNYLSTADSEIKSSSNIIDGELLEFAENNAVKFSGAPFSFSMMEALRYNEWLNSIANMKSKIDGIDAIATKAEIFNRDDSDPREMIAALIADKNENKLVDKILSDDKYKNGITRLNIYLNEYNNIASINSISTELDPKIKRAIN